VADVSLLRLHLLRAMYLLIAIGLGLTVWPLIVAPPELLTDSRSIVRAMLGALALVSLLGLRHPLQMLPLLLFELAWKLVWVLCFALPAWLGPGLDQTGWENLFACMLGVVLVPIVLPWRYVIQRYLVARGERWR